MTRFLVGFVSGFAIAAVPAAASGGLAPLVLVGWEIVVDGEPVCDDPVLWPALREVHC